MRIEIEQEASNESPACMTKWFVGATHRIRRKHKKLTLGGLIPADCVGRLDASQMTG